MNTIFKWHADGTIYIYIYFFQHNQRGNTLLTHKLHWAQAKLGILSISEIQNADEDERRRNFELKRDRPPAPTPPPGGRSPFIGGSDSSSSLSPSTSGNAKLPGCCCRLPGCCNRGSPYGLLTVVFAQFCFNDSSKIHHVNGLPCNSENDIGIKKKWRKRERKGRRENICQLW